MSISEKEYQRLRKSVQRLQLLATLLPLALIVAVGVLAFGFWWTH